MIRYVAMAMLFSVLSAVSVCVQAMPVVQGDPSMLYRGWSVEAGLPQVSVTAMAQDEQGYIWLGTQGGLARFDGHQFTVFNTANTPQLLSNLVTTLYLDSNKRLWIGTVNGLSYFAGFASAAVVVISIQAWLIHSQSTAQRL